MKIYYKSGKPKICKICGREFTIKGGSKYCSDECKRLGKINNWHDNHHEKIVKTCCVCGNNFEINKTKRASGDKFKYCSELCKGKRSRRAKYDRICVVCGKEFISSNNKTKTCSSNCLKQLFAMPRKSEAEKQATHNRANARRRQVELSRRKTDISFSLKNRMRILMYHAIRNEKGSKKWQDIVGYTIDDLKAHLEEQFTPGMTWDKFMSGDIHIDHVIPISAYSITSPNDSDFKKCWSLDNLQPLWAIDNIKKKDKLDYQIQPFLAMGA